MSERYVEFSGDPNDLEPVALPTGFAVERLDDWETVRRELNITEVGIDTYSWPVTPTLPEQAPAPEPPRRESTATPPVVAGPRHHRATVYQAASAAEHVRSPQTRRTRLGLKAAALAMALTSVPVAVVTYNAIHAHQEASASASAQPTSPNISSTPNQHPKKDECPALDPASLETARQLIAAANSKPLVTAEDVTHANIASPNDDADTAWTKAEVTFDAKDQLAHDAASKDDVTLHESNSYAKNLLKDLTLNPNAPQIDFVTYFNQARDFAALYGLDVHLGGGGPKNYSCNMRPATMPEYQTKEAKQSMYNLIETLGVTPVEYIKSLNIHDVVLVYQPDQGKDGKNVVAYNQSTGDNRPDTLVVNLRYATAPDQYRHEWWHSEDEEECGTADRNKDPAYIALNHGDAYVGDNDSQRRNYDDTRDDIIKLGQQVTTAEQQGDTNEADRLRRTIADKQAAVTFPTGYAETQAVEDKAEIGSWITEVDGQRYIDALASKGPLRDKFVYLVGRLSHRSKQIAQYFLDVNDHVVTPSK